MSRESLGIVWAGATGFRPNGWTHLNGTTGFRRLTNWGVDSPGLTTVVNYGVNTHCRALDMGMWGMILHCDIVAGQSTLPD